MNTNTFGKLVRAYREQRGWKQQELADRWGFTREYVSQIERGKRKLDKQEQIIRLADILGIPSERLEAVGKGILSKSENSLAGDDVLLQALLEPAETTVKLSWILWRDNSAAIDIEESLQDLESRLSHALQVYRGQFYKPALRLLAYVYEMRGKLAIERTATQQAIARFQDMYGVAEELGDANLIMLAQIHQAEMFRRRNWYEAAFRRIEATRNYIKKHGEEVVPYIQGLMWKAYAITYFSSGDEQGFLQTIERAEAIAENSETTIDTVNSEFDKVEILQTKAQGNTQLWHPDKALEIYTQTDILRPFRPIRDQSSYAIVKAQAYCYVGDMKKGPEYARVGLKMAERLHSVRYVIRLLQMSNRLQDTKIGQEQAMKQLREEIVETLRRMQRQED